MIKIGDKLLVTPKFLQKDDSVCRRTAIGTVVWIHPKLRFVVMEFLFGANRIREAFELGTTDMERGREYARMVDLRERRSGKMMRGAYKHK